MARREGLDNLRFDALSNTFDDFQVYDKGRFFGKQKWDSRSVSVVHVGVDTVKQLYSGMVKQNVFDFVSEAYDSGLQRITIDGYIWKLGSGRFGGYRYSLNNPDLGILVLFGSFYTESKYEADHLKIEVSPHYILNKTLDSLQECIDEFADIFIHLRKYTGVAVHLCVDVQGWEPPSDLDSKLVTRAKTVRKFSGESEISFERHAIARVYGQGQTFTFGGAASLQFSVYNKSKLISKNENVCEYWHSVYSARCVVDGEDFHDPDSDIPVFKKDVDVWRIEARFHHSVVAQFSMSLGEGEDLRSFKSLGKHLTGLWRYALNNFRLDDSPTYISTVWQFFRDDVEFNHDANSLVYRRVFKKTDFNTPPSERVLKIVFGLLCSCYRKLKYDLDRAFFHFQNSGIYSQFIDMLLKRNGWKLSPSAVFSEDDFPYYNAIDAEFDILRLMELKLFPPQPLALESENV